MPFSAVVVVCAPVQAGWRVDSPFGTRADRMLFDVASCCGPAGCSLRLATAFRSGHDPLASSPGRAPVARVDSVAGVPSAFAAALAYGRCCSAVQHVGDGRLVGFGDSLQAVGRGDSHAAARPVGGLFYLASGGGPVFGRFCHDAPQRCGADPLASSPRLSSVVRVGLVAGVPSWSAIALAEGGGVSAVQHVVSGCVVVVCMPLQAVRRPDAPAASRPVVVLLDMAAIGGPAV